RGTEYGYIVSMPQQVEDEVAGNDLKPVKRIATVKDQIQLARNRERQEAAFDICLEKIKKLQVPMKLLRAEYTFDRTKIIFLFTADG
ncbi:regulatory iron-sulfur-containing complex subunit RicT, partial [Salmonella enterica]|uniref:regulatory iron-sulfur-containing complex subunit RicT n=1 Tax=Salmonella enterica TaxID=28901 RepID=UPI003CF1FDD5